MLLEVLHHFLQGSYLPILQQQDKEGQADLGVLRAQGSPFQMGRPRLLASVEHWGVLKTLSLPPFGTATAPTPQIPLWFHYGEERQGAPPSAPQPAATATTLSKATGLTQL